MRSARGWIHLAGPAAVAVLAVAITGCSSSKSSSSTGSGSPSTSTSSALGADKKAAGEAVKIGFVSDGKSATIDNSDDIRGAQMATSYINDHLGGIGGRPIDLVTCQSLNQPAVAADCGHQLVSAGVSAVLAGTPSQVDPWVTVASAANIPVVLASAATTVALTTPNVYLMANPLSAFGEAAAIAREKSFKRVDMIVIDVPGATGPAKSLMPAFMKNAGGTVNIIPVAPGTADMTPQMQTASDDKADAIYIIGIPAFCTSALKSIKSLAIKTPVMILDSCIDNTNKGATIPGGYKGTTVVVQSQVLKADNADYQLYKAVFAQYGGSNKDTQLLRLGYQAAIGFARLVNASGSSDVTAAGINAAIPTAPAQQFPLGGGATYQCNGTAVPTISKNICGLTGAEATADTDGTLSNFRVPAIDGIYKLG
ncbi:MAG: Branched-chain amino acid transport system substrate-binding protein [Pseudonocardiales bacterium]|nr:Branched-chain amino acid transport system substrate-binding protein [Pseudonocardiales bacterium]